MNQSAVIRRLTDRLKQIESELMAIRQELSAFPSAPVQKTLPEKMTEAFADKALFRAEMAHLLRGLSIEEKPVTAEMVQNKMAEADLTANELSHSIVAAREE